MDLATISMKELRKKGYLDDMEVSAGVKVRASQILLDLSLKNREQADIISRIQNLEEMLKKQ